MSGLPALCPSCGVLFPVTNVFGGSTPSVTLINTSAFCPMPGCGAEARIPDGEYAINDGVFELLKGSKFTQEQVAKLAAIQTEIRRAGGVTDDILAAADAVAPEIGAVLRLAQKNKWRTAALAGIILFAMKTCGGSGITVNIGNETHITQTVVPGSYALRDPNETKQQKGTSNTDTSGKGPGKE